MDPDVDELAGHLFALDMAALDTKASTSLITREIIRWAIGRGWSARMEARVHATDPVERADRLGFIDVIVRRGHGQPDLAIEIDSFHKPWSLDKLRHAAAGGMHAVWIRWGDDHWAGIYDDIDVIQLYEIRVSGFRSAEQGQLELRL